MVYSSYRPSQRRGPTGPVILGLMGLVGVVCVVTGFVGVVSHSHRPASSSLASKAQSSVVTAPVVTVTTSHSAQAVSASEVCPVWTKDMKDIAELFTQVESVMNPEGTGPVAANRQGDLTKAVAAVDTKVESTRRDFAGIYYVYEVPVKQALTAAVEAMGAYRQALDFPQVYKVGKLKRNFGVKYAAGMSACGGYLPS